ncbi:nucleolar protein nop56 [Entamoeba marina]
MLILHETPAGYAIFKVNNEELLEISSENDYLKELKSCDPTTVVTLDYLLKFGKTDQAVGECQAVNDGTLTPSLQKFLKATVMKSDEKKLIVVDSALTQSIKNELQIECVNPPYTLRLSRLIRENITQLIPEITTKEMHSMQLGLSNNWSSYKIKFSPEKIDTMIIQAVSLLDDLDKEINTYSMRVREWYGWHFPELSKHVTDHSAYCQLVLKIGMRFNATNIDLKEIVDPSVEEEIKNSSVISMGSEISDEDLINIQALCTQTIEIVHYREQLWDYLKQRMNAIAPNLSVLLGELVGARLISHTGSLINLAKAPGSTIQILGAEKALFRALKTKKKTPKYGLIYHASLIGQANAKSKGQISRVLASKAALCARVDALADSADSTIGEKGRNLVEERLRITEDRATGKPTTVNTNKYTRKQEDIATTKQKFNTNADSTLPKASSVKFEESSSSDSSSSDSEESSNTSKGDEIKNESSSSDSSSESSSDSSSDSSSESDDKETRKRKSAKEEPLKKEKEELIDDWFE